MAIGIVEFAFSPQPRTIRGGFQKYDSFGFKVLYFFIQLVTLKVYSNPIPGMGNLISMMHGKGAFAIGA